MQITVNINNDLSRVLGNIARQKALSIKVPMVIAFTDTRGELVYFERMDKSLHVSCDIAINKAYTASGLRIPTHEVAEITKPGQSLCGLELTNGGRMVIFGGGYPLEFDGNVVGAIGVSGGSVQEDMVVARKAVDAFAQMEEMSGLLATLLPEPLQNFDTLARHAESMDSLDSINPLVLEGAFYLMQKDK